MKFNSEVFNVDIQDCIHWFLTMSAIGKSYMQEFVRSNGVSGIQIYMISNREEYNNLDTYVGLLGDTGILVLDRTVLYLTDEEIGSLVKYKDKRILVDRKDLPTINLLRYTKTVFIEYTGESMTLTD